MLSKHLLKHLPRHLPEHLPTPSPRRYRLAVATILLVLCAGAAAAQAPLPAAIEEAASLSPLTLLALAGTLFAGAVAGAGVATWRHRRPTAPPAPVIEVGDVAVSADIVPEPAVPKPAVPEPAVVEPEPLAVFQRDGRGPETVGDWIDELASGIQARAVGLFADGGDDKVAAITRIADDARRLDHDVIIVDTDRSAGQLASAFDGRIGPRTGLADPFGAQARIEIVPFATLFPRGYRPDDGDWSNAFVDLSARADLILVNLPAIEHWNAIPSLIASLDDTVLLRSGAVSDRRAAGLCDAARRAGGRVSAQIVSGDRRESADASYARRAA